MFFQQTYFRQTNFPNYLGQAQYTSGTRKLLTAGVWGQLHHAPPGTNFRINTKQSAKLFMRHKVDSLVFSHSASVYRCTRPYGHVVCHERQVPGQWGQ